MRHLFVNREGSIINSTDLTDLELLKYAEEHIQYEYDMFLWSARLLAFFKPEVINGAIGWVVHNGLLNTFSIHARNLVQFLYPSGNKKDRHTTDISIENYLAEATILEIRPPMPELLSEVITKANKQVAHLTTERIKYEVEGKGWNFLEIASEITEILFIMAPYIPDEKISLDF